MRATPAGNWTRDAPARTRNFRSALRGIEASRGPASSARPPFGGLAISGLEWDSTASLISGNRLCHFRFRLRLRGAVAIVLHQRAQRNETVL